MRCIARDDFLSLLTQARDSKVDNIVRMQVLRWLHCEPNTRRRASRDDITGFKLHKL
jgi:hypothetical protein